MTAGQEETVETAEAMTEEERTTPIGFPLSTGTEADIKEEETEESEEEKREE